MLQKAPIPLISDRMASFEQIKANHIYIFRSRLCE